MSLGGSRGWNQRGNWGLSQRGPHDWDFTVYPEWQSPLGLTSSSTWSAQPWWISVESLHSAPMAILMDIYCVTPISGMDYKQSSGRVCVYLHLSFLSVPRATSLPFYTSVHREIEIYWHGFHNSTGWNRMIASARPFFFFWPTKIAFHRLNIMLKWG